MTGGIIPKGFDTIIPIEKINFYPSKKNKKPRKIAILPPYLSVITPNSGLNAPHKNNCKPIAKPNWDIVISKSVEKSK